MSKDPFQEFADALDLVRFEMQRLQRTSLDKEEAKKLNQTVTKAALFMEQTTKAAPAAIKEALKADRDQMAQSATEAATKAAQGVMSEIRQGLDNERAKFSQAAGEARREAWRWFGGFWVWLASIGATGALLGALAMAWIGGTIAARDFGEYPGIFCSGAGGQTMESDTWVYCAVPIRRK